MSTLEPLTRHIHGCSGLNLLLMMLIFGCASDSTSDGGKSKRWVLAWLGAGIQWAEPPGHGKGHGWKLSILSAAAAATITTPSVLDQVMLFTAKTAYEPNGRLGFPAIPSPSPRMDASSAAASIWASRRASRERQLLYKYEFPMCVMRLPRRRALDSGRTYDEDVDAQQERNDNSHPVDCPDNLCLTSVGYPIPPPNLIASSFYDYSTTLTCPKAFVFAPANTLCSLALPHIGYVAYDDVFLHGHTYLDPIAPRHMPAASSLCDVQSHRKLRRLRQDPLGFSSSPLRSAPPLDPFPCKPMASTRCRCMPTYELL
ncbi:hypothetical protein TgHK011_005216 [Trichoderma gracile]|nr:hypothetical protein TgHK011_005216 [Trichoderma gracile]